MCLVAVLPLKPVAVELHVRGLHYAVGVFQKRHTAIFLVLYYYARIVVYANVFLFCQHSHMLFFDEEEHSLVV